MHKIMWNTGRQYSKDGQHMEAFYDDEAGTAFFHDFARDISGKFSVFDIEKGPDAAKFSIGLSVWTLKNMVMEHYDSGQYTAVSYYLEIVPIIKGQQKTTVAVAQKTLQNGKVVAYALKQDDKGYYWDGLEKASWRRKTREAVDRRAMESRFVIVERNS